VPLYRRTYDATGSPTGTVEYSFRRRPRNRIGCLGWTFIVAIGAFVLLWPLDLQPHVLTAAQAWMVTVAWWCLLSVIPLIAWARPRLRQRNRQQELARRAGEAKQRALAGRPDVDLREVGQDGL
jgi:cyanate permease